MREKERERAKGREEGSNGIYSWRFQKKLRWGGKRWVDGWMDKIIAN